MDVELLAKGLAVNRIVFGLGLLADPALAGRTWLGGRLARHPAASVLGRGLGARDVVMGAGALLALRDGDGRPWMAGQVLSDGTDLLATLAARDRLPRGPALFGMTVAAASTAIAAAYLARAGAASPPVDPAASPLPGAAT